MVKHAILLADLGGAECHSTILRISQPITPLIYDIDSEVFVHFKRTLHLRQR